MFEHDREQLKELERAVSRFAGEQRAVNVTELKSTKAAISGLNIDGGVPRVAGRG